MEPIFENVTQLFGPWRKVKLSRFKNNHIVQSAV